MPISATAGTPVSNLEMILRATATRKLSGKITFLASNNSVVDITLIHSISCEAIPALFTFNEAAGLTYELNGIPEGTYIVLASYRNDGYVMDPDWSRKSGLPTVTFSTTDTLKITNFSVTDAIIVLSPTNPPDSAYPIIVYADDAKDPNIQALISSSKDLKGLFMVDTKAHQ